MIEYNAEEIIRRIGADLIKGYEIDGKVSCGINGPYDDPETPVRNLCHLMVITAEEILLFGRNELKHVFVKMCTDLLSMKNDNGLFEMRNKKGKDNCNGVIGHAWVIEALIYAYRVLHDKIFLERATDIALKHAFQMDLSLWAIPNTEPSDYTIDYTFNHQLWYAASLAELNFYIKDSVFAHQINAFIASLPKNMNNSRYGKISHTIYNRIQLKNRIKGRIKKVLDLINEFLNRKSLEYKEQGYHVFNLAAFARLNNVLPMVSLKENVKILKAFDYVYSKYFIEGLENRNFIKDISLNNQNLQPLELSINVYGYPYNVPGFELPFVAKSFKDQKLMEIADKCIARQLELTFDNDNYILSKCVHDVHTVNYRIYEYYRYLELR